jgi:N-acetylneuraminic acid mutarotase
MNYSKKTHFSFIAKLLCLAVLILALPSCEEGDDSYVGNWVNLGDFEGVTRSDAVSFTIQGKAYVATGYQGDDDERLNDLWEYDPERDTWTQKADFPGVARNAAVAFGTSTCGYLGTGYDGEDELSDFWEYNPQTDSWRQIEDFPGTPRYGAVAFSINDKGYVGTGYDGNFLKDFWEYEPASETWTQRSSVGGSKRRDAVAFVIEGLGYICTGTNNGINESDFWSYDPLEDSWTQLRHIENRTDESFDDEYTSIVGYGGVAFSADTKAYLVTQSNYVWEYDPDLDLWEQRTDFEGATRAEFVAFALNNTGYVGLGRNGSYYYDDIWRFDPMDYYEEFD